MGKKKVVYLFGAGASAQTIRPDLTEEIKDGISLLLQMNLDDPRATTIKQDFLNDCQKVLSELRGITIDEYAKRLMLNPNVVSTNEDLRRLKLVLSLWLSQIQKGRPIDPRYKSFFSTIFRGSEKQIPDNATILSWNYDSQFEIAYGEFCSKDPSVNWMAIKEELGVIGKHLAPLSIRTRGPKIFQLNGNAADATFSGKPETLLGSRLDEPLGLVGVYRDLKTSGDFGLSFAYERLKDGDYNILEAAKEAIKNTDVLIVVGYSFAPTNNEFDTPLLRSIGQPDKIIIQDDMNGFAVERRIKDILGTYHWVNKIRFQHEPQEKFYCAREILE